MSNRVEKIEESRLAVLPQCSVEEGRQLRFSLDQLDADWRQINNDYNISLRYCISLWLNFFHLLAGKANLEKKIIFIKTNSFIIFTSLIQFTCPMLLASGLAQRLLYQCCQRQFVIYQYECNVTCRMGGEIFSRMVGASQTILVVNWTQTYTSLVKCLWSLYVIYHLTSRLTCPLLFWLIYRNLTVNILISIYKS